MDCEVHFGYPDRLVGFLLSVNGNFARCFGFFAILEMPFNKLHGLHKHTAGATCRIVDIALVWLKDFNDEFDNRGRGKKFSTTGPVRNCELAQEVFVNSPECVALNIIGNLIEILKKRDYG